MLIAVKGPDGFEMWIESRLVMSVKRHIDSTIVKPKCMIDMKLETASVEWTLADDARRVRDAVNKANCEE